MPGGLGVAKKAAGAGGAPPPHTPLQAPKGQVLPGAADDLWATASEAARAGEPTKAAHFYTMAIDAVARGMPRDQDGRATDADLLKFNRAGGGKLARLLSERSGVYLKLGDVPAAVEDAETSTIADPADEKAHLRLAVAFEAAGAALQVQLEACERGLAECPGSKLLVNRKWRLKKAIASQPEAQQQQQQQPPQQGERRGGPCAGADAAGANAAAGSPSVEETRRLADDASDPRRAMAAADLGSVLAAGTHGVGKDLREAEKYLRIGSEGGDVSAQRHLGIVLLELGRPVEGAEELSKAASAGDERAAEILQQLSEEAESKRKEARAKLEMLAASGDPRAKAMLEELQLEA